MQDETLQTEENVGAADDYFAGHTELIDDNGAPLSEPEEKLEAKPAVKPAVKPAAKPDVKTEPEGLKEVPDGFEGRFFEKGEKGVTFKGDDAMNFLFPDGETPTRFKYSPINIVPEDPAAAAASKGDDVPAWKKQLEEEKTYRTNLRTSLLSPLEHYKQALKANYTPEQALTYAEQQTLSAFEEHITERQYELEAKRREELEKEGTSKGEIAELRSRAAANEALFYAEAGGKEAFDALMFGTVGKDGKPKPGVGSEDIWMLFKLSNPDVQTSKMTAKQLNEKMATWWTRYASNKENLAYAWKIVKGTLFEKMRPYIIDKTRATVQNQIQSNREGNFRRAGLQPSARTPRGEQNSTLDAYFNPMESREGIASV